jgi:hypothetical protein
MLVDMKVVLLVEEDKTIYTSYVELETLGTFMCMYMMTMDASTRRWTLTSSKIDEPSGPRFHFEKFLGTDVGRCEGHTLG